MKEVSATEAFDSFAYQIRKAIGSYVAILGGLDTIILTATASERSPTLRHLILSNLDSIGIKLDLEKNELCIGRDGLISKKDSEVTILIVKTDESDEILRASESIN
jgi:acetate kinase